MGCQLVWRDVEVLRASKRSMTRLALATARRRTGGAASTSILCPVQSVLQPNQPIAKVGATRSAPGPEEPKLKPAAQPVWACVGVCGQCGHAGTNARLTSLAMPIITRATPEVIISVISTRGGSWGRRSPFERPQALNPVWTMQASRHNKQRRPRSPTRIKVYPRTWPPGRPAANAKHRDRHSLGSCGVALRCAATNRASQPVCPSESMETPWGH